MRLRGSVIALTFVLAAAGTAAAVTAKTITGTARSDMLRGTGGDDLIRGLGGDDTLRGGAGSDRLVDGDGNDRLFGDGGDDTLIVQAHSDFERLYGGGGDDRLVSGGGGVVDLVGGPGNDVLIGNSGVPGTRADFAADTFSGGPGDDRILRVDPRLGDGLRIDGCGPGNDVLELLRTSPPPDPSPRSESDCERVIYRPP